MTVVIDSTVLVAYLLKEKGHNLDVVSELLKNGVVSSDLIIAESANGILVSMRRRLTSEENGSKAFEALEDLAKTNIKIIPQAGLIHEAFKIARENNLAVYDALFLAIVAESKGGEFVSYDGRQVEIARKLGLSIFEGA